MVEHHFKIEVQGDHLERLANARPVQAVAELVWNSLDADATKVDIEVGSNEFGLQSVTVRDNGHGIPYGDAPDLFRKLGGSWKAHGSRSKIKGRMLHGKEGKGRFKALAIGRVADWFVVYAREGLRFRYTITLIRDNLVDVRITDEATVEEEGTGIEVRITEPHHDFRSLLGDTAIQELSETFAIYLNDYLDVTISFQNQKLDPSTAIASRKPIKLAPIVEDGHGYQVDLEIIEWRSATERVVYLCSENGFPLQRLAPRVHVPGFQFSAYLKSEYITQLHERGILDLAEMNPGLQTAYESAQEQIKHYFRDRELENARSHLEQWKAEKVYPYPEPPQNPVEEATRKVFDIVALNVNHQLPDFATADRRSKAFQLRMLRTAIESGPEDLQLILDQFLGLPPRKQQELAKLLKEASLSNVISAAKLITDRLKFLTALEALLFDPDLKKALKERSQLHRLLAENSWVFGEEFNLTVDDQSLTEVLRKHAKLAKLDVVIDKPVTRIDGSRGVVDLMLSRAVPCSRADEREHLVVELKAPKVRIGAGEITQVQSYALAVAKDERFRSLNTRWNFWAISSDMDDYANDLANKQNWPVGLIHESADGQIRIWVKTWSQVIEGCNSRLRFVKEKLEHNVDRPASLAYLRSTYEKYLAGVIMIDAEDAGESDTAADAEAVTTLAKRLKARLKRLPA